MRVFKYKGQLLILGDCYEVLPKLSLGSVDAIVTDMPYGVSHATVIRTPTFAKQKSRLLKSQQGKWDEFSVDWVPLAANLLGEGSVLVFTDKFKVTQVADAFCNKTDGKWRRYDVLTWHKRNPMPAAMKVGPTNATESIVYLIKGGSHYQAKVAGFRHNVFDYPICRGKERLLGSDGKVLHRTQKPLILMIDLIQFFTRPDDLVLDPFGGVGTTAVACLLTGRQSIVIEREPVYWRAAAKRLKEYK